MPPRSILRFARPATPLAADGVAAVASSPSRGLVTDGRERFTLLNPTAAPTRPSYLADSLDRAVRFLLNAQTAEGGWGYRLGGGAFVEPTGLALLALDFVSRLPNIAVSTPPTALAWFARAQRIDGGWGAFYGDDQSSWQTAIAVWALAATHRDPSVTGRGADWLLRSVTEQPEPFGGRPAAAPPPVVGRKMSGWAWTPNTYSWVVPTALAIVALRALDIGAHAVEPAVNLLLDRQCLDGGWNIGNPWMLDKIVPSSMPETAIALFGIVAGGLAPGHAAVDAGLAALRGALAATEDMLNLAWGLIVLNHLDRVPTDLVARLLSGQETDGGWQDSPSTTALALLALAGGVDT